MNLFPFRVSCWTMELGGDGSQNGLFVNGISRACPWFVRSGCGHNGAGTRIAGETIRLDQGYGRWRPEALL